MPINEVGTEQCNLWVWGHSHFWTQIKKKVTGPDQVLDSYVSLCNNFADRVRSTVVSHKKTCVPQKLCLVNATFQIWSFALFLSYP